MNIPQLPVIKSYSSLTALKQMCTSADKIVPSENSLIIVTDLHLVVFPFKCSGLQAFPFLQYHLYGSEKDVLFFYFSLRENDSNKNSSFKATELCLK